MDVDLESSDLTSSGYVNVLYHLKCNDKTTTSSSLWSEDCDSLCLQVVTNAYDVVALGCPTSNGIEYEVMEYINEPEIVSSNAVHRESSSFRRFYHICTVSNQISEPPKSTLIGRVRMKLPTFGGRFYVTYVRNVKSTSSVNRRVIAAMVNQAVLGKSNPFSVVSPLYVGVVDSNRRSLPSKSPFVNRRGVKTIKSCEKLSSFVEDNKNIKVLNIMISLSAEVKQTISCYYFSRVMMWASTEANSTDTIRLLFEFDIILPTLDGKSTSETIYAVFLFSRCCIYDSERDSDRLGGLYILKASQARAEVDSQGRIGCRLPYITSDSNFLSSSDTDIMNNVTESFGRLLITCTFCSKSLLDPTRSIDVIRPLPSGVLDNVRLIPYYVNIAIQLYIRFLDDA